MNFDKIKTQKWLLNIFFLRHLPLAFIAGLKLISLDTSTAKISLKHGYFNKNPFKSIYFACLAMAAELSCGVLLLYQISKAKKNISTLVTGMQANFYKKATGKIRFECEDGNKILEILNNEITIAQGTEIQTISKGYNEENQLVASFTFTWGVKQRKI